MWVNLGEKNIYNGSDENVYRVSFWVKGIEKESYIVF